MRRDTVFLTKTLLNTITGGEKKQLTLCRMSGLSLLWYNIVCIQRRFHLEIHNPVQGNLMLLTVTHRSSRCWPLHVSHFCSHDRRTWSSPLQQSQSTDCVSTMKVKALMTPHICTDDAVTKSEICLPVPTQQSSAPSGCSQGGSASCVWSVEVAVQRWPEAGRYGLR